MKCANKVDGCAALKHEFNTMNNIQHQTSSLFSIKTISAFHTLRTNTLYPENNMKPVPRRCMFLQEKIHSAKQLAHVADILKYEMEIERVSKTDALNFFVRCYKQVSYFSNKLHSIGYIHSDISIGNIVYGIKISVEVSLTNSTFGNTYTYELVNTSQTKFPRCYIIDYGSSISARILTINHSSDQQIKREMILPPLSMAHPFFYKFRQWFHPEFI